MLHHPNELRVMSSDRHRSRLASPASHVQSWAGMCAHPPSESRPASSSSPPTGVDHAGRARAAAPLSAIAMSDHGRRTREVDRRRNDSDQRACWSSASSRPRGRRPGTRPTNGPELERLGRRYLQREADVALSSALEAGLAPSGAKTRLYPVGRRGIWPRAVRDEDRVPAQRRDGHLAFAWVASPATP